MEYSGQVIRMEQTGEAKKFSESKKSGKTRTEKAETRS
jgi:hypothetical protein